MDKIRMEEIRELLFYLKENYVMFFGKKSLHDLMEFIGGYIHCMDKRDGDIMMFLPGFGEYVAEYHDIRSQPWPKVLEFFSIYEETAFDSFFELLDKFWKEKKHELGFDYPIAISYTEYEAYLKKRHGTRSYGGVEYVEIVRETEEEIFENTDLNDFIKERYGHSN